MFIEIFNWVNISSDVSSRLTWFKASVGLEVLTGGSSDWEGDTLFKDSSKMSCQTTLWQNSGKAALGIANCVRRTVLELVEGNSVCVHVCE